MELQEAMGTIETAADRTQRILQDLLLLARSDNGQLTLPMRPLPLPGGAGRRAHRGARRQR